MKNTVLLQELREMLDGEHYNDLRAFCASNTPQVIAGFLEALDIDEIIEVLSLIDQELAAEIFICFDSDVRPEVVKSLPDNTLAHYLFFLPDALQESVFKTLSAERLASVRSFIDHYEKEEEEEIKEREAQEKGQLLYDHDGELLENIKVYKSTPQGLKKIGKIEKHCWINVEDPDPEEIAFLANHFHIPVDFLTSSLDMDERARVEKDDNGILIILRVPVYSEASTSLLYSTMAMGIILTNDVIITLSARPNVVITDFVEGKIRNLSFDRPDKFILKLFYRSVLLYLLYLKQINNITNVIQQKILESSQNKQLIKMLNLEKSLVYFSTSLKSNELMMSRLIRGSILKRTEDTEDFIEDIEIELKQAIEMSNIYSNILSGLMDAFASIISNNLNIVMKLLTLITIILAIPVAFTSLFSMNVDLPFSGPYAFEVIIFLSFVSILATVVFFKRRKWF